MLFTKNKDENEEPFYIEKAISLNIKTLREIVA